MSKVERVRTRNARERIAVQQAAVRRAETRRRMLIAAAAPSSGAGRADRADRGQDQPVPAAAVPTATDPAVARLVTTVPGTTFDRVGSGTATGLKATTGQPLLMKNGKPELLYMGGQYCPFCAAERWAIAAAVSRFGILSGLRFIHSSPTDYAPNTPTLSFDRAHYSSRYLSFVPVEWYGEKPDPSTPFGHVYFQHPTTEEQALFSKYSGESLPFVDIGNQYLVPQAQYAPTALAGLTWAQVAAALHHPSSGVASDIDGAANQITAAICKLTQGQPGGVCTRRGCGRPVRPSDRIRLCGWVWSAPEPSAITTCRTCCASGRRSGSTPRPGRTSWSPRTAAAWRPTSTSCWPGRRSWTWPARRTRTTRWPGRRWPPGWT